MTEIESLEDGSQSLPNGDSFRYEYLGKPMPTYVPAATLEAIKTTFDVRSDDIIVGSYLESGNNLLRDLVSHLCSSDDNAAQIKRKPLADRVPFLEIGPGASFLRPNYEMLAGMRSPRLMSTHLPYEWMPVKYYDVDIMPKTIYVARNPKDVAVSCWKFSRRHPYMETVDEWNDYFDMFFAGDVLYGSWVDHVLGWWNRRHDSNVLFLYLEDLISSPKYTVENIAEFLNVDMSYDDIGKVLQQVSLPQPPQQSRKSRFTKSDYDIFRAGMIGDWRQYFTITQDELFHQVYLQDLTGTGMCYDFI
ncbi:sulfotransferase 1B1-like [Glandiceps talaboti]